MSFFANNLEKDFEFFVKNITRLAPIEFIGLAKVLSVPTVRDLSDIGMTLDEIKTKSAEEMKALSETLARPAPDILEEMMDRFLELPRRRRKEINQILKDAQRGR